MSIGGIVAVINELVNFKPGEYTRKMFFIQLMTQTFVIN